MRIFCLEIAAPSLLVSFSFLTCTAAFACEEISDRLYKSKFICIGKYTGYKPDETGKISYDHPPIVTYSYVTTLKGPIVGAGFFPLIYEFHNKENKKEPKDWSFNENMMPEKGSWWLIFAAFENRHDYGIDTIGFPEGRIKYSREQLDKYFDKLGKLHHCTVDRKEREEIYSYVESPFANQ